MYCNRVPKTCYAPKGGQFIMSTSRNKLTTGESSYCIKNVCFYIAQNSVRWTAQSYLYFAPWQTCSFQHLLDFSEKHSSQAAITHQTRPFDSIGVLASTQDKTHEDYLFIHMSTQLSELGHNRENENAKTLKR